MKKLLAVIISLTLVLCLTTGLGIYSSAAAGTTYYIDSATGDDANSGTSPESPWKTLSSKSDFDFQPGDTILLKAGGVYKDLFITRCSGTKEAPITLSSYGDTEKDGLPLVTTDMTGHVIVLVNASNWIIENLEITAPYGGGIHVQCTNSTEENIENYIKGKKEEYKLKEIIDKMIEEEENPSEPGEELSLAERLEKALENVKGTLNGAIDSIKSTVEDILDYIDEEPVEPAFDESLPAELVCENLTFRNLKMHDISNLREASPYYDSSNRAIRLNTSGQGTRFVNITVADSEIYDSALGIEIKGNNAEERKEYFISPEESYNRNFVVDNVRFADLGYDALVIGAVKDGTVRNCSAINTCIYSDGFTAPIWMHWCDSITVENCEVAGTKNTYDGMTVDFDGWTTNSTYQYVYSHDNTCFVKSNTFDGITKNSNNTVRYCLSVNDNNTFNMVSFVNFSKKFNFSDHAWSMDGLKFYNNTVINCAPTIFGIISNSYVENNIFVGSQSGTSLALYLGANNKITNNCFYYMTPPVSAYGNYFCDPGFTGTDVNDKNSFILSADSKLIGKGIQVEEDMGEYDFYGNPLTSTHNIGCYEGTGADKEAVRTARYFPIIRAIISLVEKLIARLK